MNIAIILTFFVVILSVVLVFVFSRKKTSNRNNQTNNGAGATTNTQRNIPNVARKKKGFTPPGTITAPPKEPKQVIIEKKLEENIGEEVKPAIELHSIEENEFKKHYVATKFDKLQPENSSGNIQYFMIAKIQDGDQLKTLLEQLKFRISQGNGDAMYEVGVTEDGTPVGFTEPDLMNSIGLLRLIAEQAFATVKIIRIRDATDGKYAAELFVRKRSDGEMYSEVRIAVCGNVDVGKSTLLGVLSRGTLDNGRGRARLNIFKHKHEIETGRTSDIGREILGFNNDGDIVNYAGARAPTWSEICEKSAKVVMFMDLAGHEKYLKTTVFGLTGNYPDYTMLMVGSNMGVIGMTKEHYHLTLALKVPCFIVVTKIDMCPPNVLETTLTVLKKMLKAPGSKKIPLIIGNADDVVLAARNFNSDRMTPVFQVSNVTGVGLDLLKLFINLISPRKDWDKLKLDPTVFHLDNTFSVPGVGTVVSGTLMKGTININQTLLLGPDEFGKFKPILVKGIHTNRLSVKTAYAGQSVSIALKKINRSQTRKGQVITAPELNPKAVWEFDAEIFVITHSTTISTNYEAVIHCGCTRQTATIVEIQGVLRANARGKVRFRYKYRPEYIEEGDRIIFREGRTKGIGNVVGLYYDAKSERTKSRKERKEEASFSSRTNTESAPSAGYRNMTDEYELVDIKGLEKAGVWVHRPGSDVAATWEPRKGRARCQDSQILRENDGCSDSPRSSVSESQTSNSSTEEPASGNKSHRHLRKVKKGLVKLAGAMRHNKNSKNASDDEETSPYETPHPNIRPVGESRVSVTYVVDEDPGSSSMERRSDADPHSSPERAGDESPTKRQLRKKAAHMVKHAGKAAHNLKSMLSRKGLDKGKGDEWRNEEEEDDLDAARVVVSPPHARGGNAGDAAEPLADKKAQ